MHATTPSLRLAVVLLAVVIPAAGCGECEKEDPFPVLSGPYLGQAAPGGEATLFAPGIVSTGIAARDVAMTPDGKEIYFGVVFGRYEFYTIMVTRLVDGKWTEPRVAPFASKYNEMEPAISPDGQKFYFFSFRPLEGEGDPKADSDIWVMDREGEGWGEPRNLGAPVNSERSRVLPLGHRRRDALLHPGRREPRIDDPPGATRGRAASPRRSPSAPRSTPRRCSTTHSSRRTRAT